MTRCLINQKDQVHLQLFSLYSMLSFEATGLYAQWMNIKSNTQLVCTVKYEYVYVVVSWSSNA
jgi:hypothetical protein